MRPSIKNSYERKFGFPQFVKRFVFDAISVLGAWFLAYFLRFFVLPGATGSSLMFFTGLAPFVLLSTLYFLNRNKLYQSDVSKTWRKEAGELFTTTFEVFATWVFIFYFFFGESQSCHAGSLRRFSFCISAHWQNHRECRIDASVQQGKGLRRILLVGYGKKMEEYVGTATEDEHGLRFVGQYDGEGGWLSFPHIQATSLVDAVEQVKADIVVISFPPEAYDQRRPGLEKAWICLPRK
jgi:FlaA1/EpsC-like NDP-sugar epimerase